MKYLVLWMKGGRIGSLPLTDMEAVKSLFVMSLIQVDATGTEHWNVLGERRTRTGDNR